MLSRRNLLRGAVAAAALAAVELRPRIAVAAQIKNIHFGLSAWSNKVFGPGARCSNAGNAYQCITGGSSTAAPTGTGSSINNGGAAVFKWLSAIDFTTPQAWIN